MPATTVVCARFADSTLAYQGYGAGLDVDAPRARSTTWRPTAFDPDLTIILDVPVEVGLARKAPGDVTRFEAEFDLAFHRRVRDGFLAIAAAEPERVAVVDATGDIDDVGAEIARARRRARSVRGEPPAPRVRIKR